MRSFDSFLKDFSVVKAKPDMLKAQDLVDQAQARFDHYRVQPFSKKTCTFVIEGLYESIRQLLDACLALEGYKSYSHESVIAFAYEKNILNHREAILLDLLRINRNTTHYYGKLMTWEYAEKTLPEAIALFDKLKKYAT
jgi:hypothetical protein